MKKYWRRFVEWWPLVSRRKMLRALVEKDRSVQSTIDFLRKNAEEKAKVHQEAVSKVCVRTYTRADIGPGYYRLEIVFDSEIGKIFGGLNRQEMEYIGDMVGHEVAKEIGSSRFVAMAHKEELRRFAERQLPPRRKIVP